MAFENIMLDAETLSTRTDAVIISIGALGFDPYTCHPSAIDQNGFYASVSPDSNHEAGPRHVSESTLAWWIGQDSPARLVFTEPKETLRNSLEAMAHYISGHGPDVRVWSNGAAFDIALLAHAFDTFGIECPWHYKNTRCYRTIRHMAMPHMTTDDIVGNSNPHHALADCYYQARRLQHYFSVLKAALRQTRVGQVTP